MPIYEYACPKCGQFETTQRITDAPLKRCPKCRSGVKKLISNTSFQLKGTGWYVTDYAGKKGGGKDKADKESKSDTSAKSDASSKSESTSSSESKSSDSKSSDSKSTDTKSSTGGKAAA